MKGNAKGERLSESWDWFEPAIKLAKIRTLHLAPQSADIRISARNEGCGYSHCCATDGTPYNMNGDALRIRLLSTTRERSKSGFLLAKGGNNTGDHCSAATGTTLKIAANDRDRNER